MSRISYEINEETSTVAVLVDGVEVAGLAVDVVPTGVRVDVYDGDDLHVQQVVVWSDAIATDAIARAHRSRS